MIPIHVTIDRIEGRFAVLEHQGQTWDWPLSALPDNAAEGVQYTVSFEPAVLTEGQARLARLRQNGPDSDDIEL